MDRAQLNAHKKLQLQLTRVHQLALLFALLFSAFSIEAQTTATLRGVVVDENAAVIAGAKITLKMLDGTAKNVVSDANGEFVIPAITAGIYSLTVEFDGFQTFNNAALRMPLSDVLKITLKIAEVNLATEIRADEGGMSTEPDQTMSAIVLDEKFIETLPDGEEEMRDYLETLAGPGAGGATGGQGGAQFIVDGFRNGKLPPKEAILKISINQNPFSAEYAHPGAGRVEIITKPGNNEWRGSGGFSFANAALNARDAFALVKPDLDQKRYSFNLSGPVVRKKISFFMNVERRGLQGSSAVRAQTLEGIFNANVPALNHGFQFSLRTDFLLNQRNTLTVSYSRSTSLFENREFYGRGGSSNFTLPERGSDLDNKNQTLRVGEVFVISPQLLLESRLQMQYETRDSVAHTHGRAINVLDAFQGGGSTCCPSQNRSVTGEWQEYLTYTRKTHTIKGGVQLEYAHNRDLSLSNFNGTFTFSSLDQYRRVLNGERVDPNDPNSDFVRPTLFTISQGDPLVRYQHYEASWFVQDDWRVNQKLTLSYGLRHEFQSQLADKINFAPRLGIAWSPFKNRRTVIRAGAGIFYDRLTTSIYQTVLHFDGVRQQSIVIRNPLWPDPFAGNPLLDAQRTIKRALDAQMKAPYVIDFNASIEKQLTKNLFASLSYTWTKGVHLFRARNINAPLPVSGIRPDPTQGNIHQTETSAQSKHQRLWLRMDRRFSPRFSLFSSYTLSWTNSDADSAFALPMNNYNLQTEWARAATDRRQFLNFGGNVSLPWRVRFTPYVNLGSGLPFNITTGQDDNLDTVINDRPANILRNSDLPASLYSQLPNRCLTGCRAGSTPVYLQDFLTKNFPNGVRAEGPELFSVNLNVSKTFGFGERKQAVQKNDNIESSEKAARRAARLGGENGDKIRAGGGGKKGLVGAENESARYNCTLSTQVTNLFNHVNFGQYSGVLTSPFFGRSNSANPARQIEISIRFSF